MSDLDPAEFRNSRYLECLQNIRVGELQQDERQLLEKKIGELVTRASALKNPLDKINSLSTLATFSKEIIQNDEISKDAAGALDTCLTTVLLSFQKSAEEMADSPMDAMDFELRSLFGILKFEQKDSPIVTKRIQEIEKEMNIDSSKTIQTTISNLSGRQLPRESSWRPSEMFGELFALPMEDGKYVLNTTSHGAWHISAYVNIDQELASLSSIDDPRKSVTITSKELAAALETGTVDELIAKAEQSFEEESRNRDELKSYALPKNGGVHLRVFPRTFDDTVSTNIASSMLFASVLRQENPNMKTLPILFDDTPIEQMEKTVQEQYEKGERFFLLDLYNHGSKSGIEFKKELRAEDILSLTRKYPQAKFQLNTIACFGGGLREGLLKELKEGAQGENVVAFLQAKPHTPNFAGDTDVQRLLSGWSQAYSTPYYLYRMQALLEGKSYGEAHADADWRAKELISTDAEAVWKGRLFVEKKAPHNTPDPESALPA